MLFVQDVPPRHMAGEVKEVQRGFARNYLVPQGLAVIATPEHMKRIAKVKIVAEQKRKVLVLKQSDLVKRIEGSAITLRARAGEGGRLYGSITNMSIADQIKRELGLEVDRRLIELPDPIRALGTYKVPVKFNADMSATVTVNVEASGQPAPTSENAEGAAVDVRGEGSPA
ncbi:MAG: 50S ribosomal protein L9 [Dehalococcoidia bacterium]|nr:50S ribosomal protein L9 [Dehalococcoidia bacterium]